MASAGSGGSLPPNFVLTPQQQSLLFAALNSNNPQLSGSSSSPGLSATPKPFKSEPEQGLGGGQGFTDNSLMYGNYDYDFADSSFDFSFADGDQTAHTLADAPETVQSESSDGDANESNEKRSYPEEDEEDEGKSAKRRESTDKAPKKPGRKPLTSEPSSKRKAQNRAAQRAFRERKEKHLKDLETKVEELEKASEAANHENSKLRAQVDRMSVELNMYKQKLQVVGNPKPATGPKVPFGNAAVSNLSDVSFQFNFPKFGTLPGPATVKPAQRSVSQPHSPHTQVQANSPNRGSISDKMSPQSRASPQDVSATKFSSVFTPSMASTITNDSKYSLDSAQYGLGATSSPSASSNSNVGASSSCGTSPEPFTQSPSGSKPIELMTTIGEEQPSLSADTFSQFANVDFNNANNFDWLAQQNGGNFDPQLFGDYREPQESILSNPSFDELFNDSLDADFFTPYNVAPSPALHKKNLIDEIDAQKDDFDDKIAKKADMSCNQLWYDLKPSFGSPPDGNTDKLDREKLQACPKAQNGEFDLDGLCSELTKKAKCSGNGPVVGEHDFDTLLKKYMGKDVSSECVAETLGIEVSRTSKPNGVNLS
ncbi:unnamed protein product [Clonostachys rhizophaga]|uniref:BZIP domain-containing protein n=1 Tax=Clonostachys rhizophaga TaxID=160324 RepID=A0A9N9V728_9HYPO|nr:unnamed protein product [Clonostachys rhizophaga]